MAKINAWAFLENFGMSCHFNITHLPICVKFYVVSEFEKNVLKSFWLKKGFLGFLWVFYDKYIYKTEIFRIFFYYEFEFDVKYTF